MEPKERLVRMREVAERIVEIHNELNRLQASYESEPDLTGEAGDLGVFLAKLLLEEMDGCNANQ